VLPGGVKIHGMKPEGRVHNGEWYCKGGFKAHKLVAKTIFTLLQNFVMYTCYLVVYFK
jgi:hypothetical protein